MARSPAEEVFQIRLDVAGSGRSTVATGLSVLDELLVIVARSARFDLDLAGAVEGPPDRRVAEAGRVLGAALADALAAPAARGVGDAAAPADEALAHVVLEASGRPLVVSNVDLSSQHMGGLRGDLLAGLLDAVADGAGLTIHVRLLHGDDAKHVLDAIAKGLGLALAQACAHWPATAE